MLTRTSSGKSLFVAIPSDVFIALARRWRLACLPLLVAVLASCGSVRRIDLPPDALSRLKGKTLAVVSYPRHTFTDLKASNQALGMVSPVLGPVGLLAAQAQGNALADQYGMEDPAAQMSELLAQRLEMDRGMLLMPASEDIASSEEIVQLIQSRPGADYILDIKSTAWRAVYLGSDWTRYRINYGARMRLIDTHTGAVIAQQACHGGPSTNDPNPPTREEMLADDARELKLRTSRAAAECLKVIAANALRLEVDWLARNTLEEEQEWQAQGPQAGSAGGALTPGTWRATMYCEQDNRPGITNNQPYSRKHDVDASHLPVFRLHHRSPRIEEKMDGRLIDGHLLLRGSGYRRDQPAVRWSLRFSGQFSSDGKRWVGNGSVLMHNSEVRACQLILRKS